MITMDADMVARVMPETYAARPDLVEAYGVNLGNGLAALVRVLDETSGEIGRASCRERV